MTATPMEIKARDADHVIAVRGATLIQLWTHETRLAATQELRRLVRSFVTTPGKRGMIVVVAARASAPSAAARAEIAAMMGESEGKLLCTAFVQEAEGFQGAMIRSVITGLALLQRHTIPYKVFPTVPEAARWMGQWVEETDQLAVAIEELRRL